jgi:hypothetical protein
MPSPPLQSSDIFSTGQFFSTPQQATGFNGTVAPAASGFGTRESQISNNRIATTTRNIMHWLVPEGPVIQMYINPQNVNYNYRKNITPTRTKGGYTIQYWGEELTVLNISGTTGTSGIEGINVLYDLYRNEQVQFDPFALFLAAKIAQSGNNSGGNSASTGLQTGVAIASSLLGASESVAPQSIQQPPTLASLAFTVELYWSGEVYRGFFTDFRVTENAEQLGLFSYEMTFDVTQKRGFRTNFLGWHRSPTSGPSNSDPQLGRPYSYGSLADGNQIINTTTNVPAGSIDPFNIF